jgi:hypothetical protein
MDGIATPCNAVAPVRELRIADAWKDPSLALGMTWIALHRIATPCNAVAPVREPALQMHGKIPRSE